MAVLAHGAAVGRARRVGGRLTDRPRSRDRDRRHAAQRIAAGGAGGHHFRAGWRHDGRDALSVPSPPPAGRRGSREPEPVDNALSRAAAGLAVGRGRVRRLARPAAPQPPPPAPLSLTAYSAERSPATAGGPGTDVPGDRLGRSPGRPRAAPRRPLLRPWPPCHGSRAMAAAPSAPQARHCCASASPPSTGAGVSPNRLEASRLAGRGEPGSQRRSRRRRGPRPRAVEALGVG